MKKIILLTLSGCFLYVSLLLGASNYYTGTDYIEPISGSPPSVGIGVTDSMTGSTVIRRTNISSLTPDSPADAMIVYSRYSPVNSNNTYAIVHGTDSTSAWVLRLSDNTIIHKVNPGAIVNASNDEIGEIHEIRWDYTGEFSNRVYFVYGMSFYYMDVINGNDESTLIRDFSSEYPAGSKIINDVEGDSSNDSRYWAFQVRGGYNGSYFPLLNIITYDIQTNTVVGALGVGDVIPTQNASSWSSEMPRPNMVEISPDGSKVITHYSRSYAGSPTGDYDGTYFDGVFAWNLDFSGTPVQISVDETHSGWAWDLSGKPLFVSQQNRTDRFEACRIDSGIYPANCTTFFNHATVGYAGVHFAKMPQSKPGYILASFYVNAGTWQQGTYYSAFKKVRIGDFVYAASSSGTTGGNEPVWPEAIGSTVRDGSVVWKNWGYNWVQNSLAMMEIDELSNSPTIWRVTPMYNDYSGNYRDEASAAISLDGNSVWWTANWNNSSTGHGEVYSVDLPSDWMSSIGNHVAPALNLRIDTN